MMWDDFWREVRQYLEENPMIKFTGIAACVCAVIAVILLLTQAI